MPFLKKVVKSYRAVIENLHAGLNIAKAIEILDKIIKNHNASLTPYTKLIIYSHMEFLVP